MMKLTCGCNALALFITKRRRRSPPDAARPRARPHRRHRLPSPPPGTPVVAGRTSTSTGPRAARSLAMATTEGRQRHPEATAWATLVLLPPPRCCCRCLSSHPRRRVRPPSAPRQPPPPPWPPRSAGMTKTTRREREKKTHRRCLPPRPRPPRQGRHPTPLRSLLLHHLQGPAHMTTARSPCTTAAPT